MLPAPIEHRFVIEGESYLLVEWTRGGEKRIRAEYAMAIAAAPTVIEAMDGADLYAEAVARECLKEAPPIFWQSLPTQASGNGAPRATITLDQVPRGLWEAFRREVDAFLGKIFPAVPAEPAPDYAAGAAESVAVEIAEAVPTVFRGRAQ
jgi:hypothetical protein